VHAPPPSHDEGSGDSKAEMEDPATLSDSQQLPGTLSSHRAHTEAADPSLSVDPLQASPSAGASTPRGSAGGPTSARMPFPPTSAQAPFFISSTNDSDFSSKRRPGNTAMRRKSLSSHNILAEATKASGEVMAMQMREMAAASRDLERSKIDIQLKLFLEQMEYQREKDRRLYENARMANENAHLAIIKQGEVVSCLAQLSNVLKVGLNVSPKGGGCSVPEAAPTRKNSLV
jgi:hypothetical protein